METYTGRRVDLARPDPSSISIDDIAWHLSRLPRFNGATRSDTIYNVAQHSVLVLNRVRQLAPDANVCLLLTALLHDAHEAYTGDVIKPMGMLLDLTQPLKRLKSRVQNAIWAGLLDGLRFDGKKFVQYIGPVIKQADQWAATYEAYHLLHSKGNWFSAKVYLEDEYVTRNVIVWPPATAQQNFLNHYRELISLAV
jgi:hypothetical protein